MEASVTSEDDAGSDATLSSASTITTASADLNSDLNFSLAITSHPAAVERPQKKSQLVGITKRRNWLERFKPQRPTQEERRAARAALASRKDEGFVASQLREGRVLLHRNGKQLVTLTPNGSAEIAWQHPDILGAIGAREEGVVVLSPNHLAIDVSAWQEAEILERAEGIFVGTRELMGIGTREALGDASRARALLTWHATTKFCGACGHETTPIEGGAKRVCGACSRRYYPRIDPVAIALVRSADDQKILLGRTPKLRKGMYTCLSGFVEPCETVEDAVRREVFEEAGVLVDAVTLWASQPWPIGRAGGCELMLACVAEASAAASTIDVDETEMEDVRWFTRQEARAAFDAAVAYAHQPAGAAEDGVVFVPGDYAIAHHLIKSWLFPPP
ncbi:hypothetical protein CTAYLR_000101 [Chrysophaeum taylorii]|uniref:NAD(+) diphosphatase n=1 Tax=Chrysophaeum taylorii TaxID=2483200 RepID=A0AAD7UGW4_9STRA|nr:hypothetical protein CTAYLR_000101 [Chrysophaeum taylorii]